MASFARRAWPLVTGRFELLEPEGGNVRGPQVPGLALLLLTNPKYSGCNVIPMPGWAVPGRSAFSLRATGKDSLSLSPLRL